MEEEIAKTIFKTFGDRKELVHFEDAKSLVTRTIDGLDITSITDMVVKMARAQEPPAFLS